MLLLLVVVSLIIPIAVAPVSAQSDGATPTSTSTTTDQGDQDDQDENGNPFVEQLENSHECDRPRAIDSQTVICDVSLDGDVAVLVLRSDKLQRVTIVDAGGLMQEGEINRGRVTLRPDEPNTVRFPITRHNGFAGVTIDTGEVLYGLPIEDNTALIGGPWTREDVTVGSLSGAASVALMSIVIVVRTVTGKVDDPERIA